MCRLSVDELEKREINKSDYVSHLQKTFGYESYGFKAHQDQCGASLPIKWTTAIYKMV